MYWKNKFNFILKVNVDINGMSYLEKNWNINFKSLDIVISTLSILKINVISSI